MSTSLSESDRENLYRVTMQGKWEKVVEIYKENPMAHKMRITNEGGTALHFAVIQCQKDIVLKLVREISKIDKTALEIQNDRGDTPLHHAASVGREDMCKYIVEAANIQSLIGIRTEETETALFIATVNGKREAFVYLHDVCSATSNSNHRYSYARKGKGGDTILHAAIDNEHFDLAYYIIHWYGDLVNSVNEMGLTPFHCLAKSSAFKSRSYNLGLWKRLIYFCIGVEKLKADQTSNLQSEGRENVIQNLKTSKLKNEQEGSSTSDVEIPISHEDTGSQSTLSSNGMQAIFLPCYDKFVKKLKTAGERILRWIIREPQELKKKHKWSDQVMDELFRHTEFIYSHKDAGIKKVKLSPEEEGEDDDMKETLAEEKPLKRVETDGVALMAVKNGAVKIVEKCLEAFPGALHDKDEKGKSMLILAAENRHPDVYSLLINKKDLSNTTFLRADLEENNVLHVAATYKKGRPWPIPGVALQMQWEMKWFEFVKDSIPASITFRPNRDGKTPEVVFSETHEQLINDGKDWLIQTSQSCSVVAALIAGVAFATSAAIPGGTLDTSGKPIFEKQPAFQVFSISSIIALCFSVNALVLFLAIITSRFHEKDFNWRLPVRLLLGLSSLFVSIGAILVCFCTGHFFIIGDRFKDVAYPVYALTCFPFSTFMLAQLPLYFDLLRTTVMNPFKCWSLYRM